MPVDVFDRDVKATLDEIKAALLSDVGKPTKAAQTDDNTEQLKKLNQNLEKIVGSDLDKEIKAIHKLLKKVTKCCDDAEKHKTRNMEKEAKAFGTAVAKSMRTTMSRGGGGEAGALKALSKLEPALVKAVDSTMTFGKVLERSQRRFSTAFGMVGKQFQKDFGAIGRAISDRIGKLNPFRMFEKEGQKSAETFMGNFRKGWDDSIAYLKQKWSAVTERVTTAWNATIGKISTALSNAYNAVANKAKEYFAAAAGAVTKAWTDYGRPALSVITAPFRWIGKGFKTVSDKIYQYVDPLGKAVAGTVKDLFQMGKTAQDTSQYTQKAQKETGDLVSGATRKVMQGEGTPVGPARRARVASPQSDLCRCICRCIGKLMGVTKDGVKTSKQYAKDSRQVAKIQSNLTKQSFQNQADQTELQKQSLRASDPREQMIREEAIRDKVERKRAMWDQRGAGVRAGILRATGGIGNILGAENPGKELAKSFATFASRAAGFIVGKPLEVLGNILEKTNIEIAGFGGSLAFLGGPLKFLGEAFGGLAEGLTSLVLQPLAEEVGNFQEEMQAMYTTRGAVGAGAGRFGDARNVLETAQGVSNMAKKEEEFRRAAEEITLTGQRYEKIQKQQMANLRRGIRDEDKLNRVHHIGLRTASQIGSNAEQTAEMFADWKINLGASNVQLNQMERGLLGIARTTGVFGDNLIRAAKASQSFMEYMRMSGTFTAKAANNIIGLMAEAEKRGVGQGMSNLLQVLQGSLLGEGGDEKSRMLAIAGIGGNERVRSRLMTGTLLQDRGAQRIFAENLGSRLNDIVRQRFGKNLDQLSIEEKGFIDPLIRQIFGRGIEELSQMIQTIQARAKTFADRMAELDQGQRRGMTQREIQTQRDQLIFDTGAEILEDFNRALREEGGDLEKAFAKLRRSSEDLAPFLNNLGADINRGGANIGDILKRQMRVVRERGTQQGLTAEVQEALGSPEDAEKRINDAVAALQRGDRTQFDNLISTMNNIENKTREQMRQNADPVTKIVTMLFKMEAYLRVLTRSVINAIAPGVQDFVGHMDQVIDNAAKEFGKGTPEGRQKAIEIIGEALRDFPAEVTRHTQNIQGQAGVSPIWTALMGPINSLFGEDGPIGAAMKTLGNIIKDAAKGIQEAIDNLRASIDGIIEKITGWAAILGTGGVLFVAIAGVIALLVGAGGLVLAFGAVTAALGPLLAALAPVATVAAAAAAPAAVIRHVEQVNQGSRDNAASAREMSAQMDTEFRRTQMQRQEAIEGMNMQQVMNGIAERENRMSAWTRGRDTLPTFYSLADQWTGRASQWDAERASFNDQINNEQRAINELRSRQLRLSIANLTPDEINTHLQKLQRGETTSIGQFGAVEGGNVPGAIQILQGALANANQQRAARAAATAAQAAPTTAPAAGAARRMTPEETLTAILGSINYTANSVDAIYEQTDMIIDSMKEQTAILQDILDVQKIAAGLDKDFNANALEEGSIYVHDTTLAKLFADLPETMAIIKDNVEALMTPMLPNMSKNAEDEIRRRKAELQSNSDDLSEVENNTGATAANTAATARMLGKIGRLLVKRQGSDLSGVEGPDYPQDAFFEDVLSTEWPNARMGRKVGLEFDYTDLA